jgi:glucose-1-phosphate thymidylyltransferase
MKSRGLMVVEGGGCGDAGGVASRNGAFQHIANRPIAHHVLDVLESAGVEEILVASSTEVSDQLHECLGARGSGLRYISRPGPLDVAGALSLAAPVIDGDPCIVHVASGLLGEPLAPFLADVRSDLPDVVLVVHQSSAPAGRLSAATQQMLHLAELDPARAALGMTGVWLFGPGAMCHMADAVWGDDGETDMTAVGERIEAAGGSVHVRLAEVWRRYTGNPLDLLELNRMALDSLRVDTRYPDNHGNSFEGRVWVHETAIVRSSVIVGPTVIGPGAQISDAYIGPYTSVGARARIEGSEIERSIVLRGASIMHIGGRLVSSVVGRNARVLRDFSLPRAVRLRVGDDAEVALC